MPRSLAPHVPDELRAYWRGVRTPEARAANAAYWRARRTTEQRRKMNLAVYGITPADYAVLLEKQGGVCAACGGPETGRNQFGPIPLAVDHDHDTGKVRGLLCMMCNRALGMLGDSADRLRRLADYREVYP